MSLPTIAMSRSRVSTLSGCVLVECISSAAAGDVSQQTIESEDGLKVDIVAITGGRFLVGDIAGNGQRDEQPVRAVQIPHFWMMRTEVTRGLFDSFVADTGHQTDNRCRVFEDGWRSSQGLS